VADPHHQCLAQVIPFSQLSLEAGGADRDQLVVKWQQDGQSRTLYVRDPLAIAAIRHTAPPALVTLVDHVAASVRRARAKRRMALLAALGVLVALGLGMWLTWDALVTWTVSLIPPAWERRIGEAALQEALLQQEILREGPVVEAISEITARLTSHIANSRYRFAVTVVRSPVVNAFALPGGYVVVFTGLIQAAKSPEEVAGVLGHEITHVLERHGLERIVHTLGIVAMAQMIMGQQQGLVGLAKQLGVELITLKYSREQETEADLLGLRLLCKAKVDPNGLVAFFERLAQSDNEKGRIELLSTHPMSAARATRLKAEVAALPTFLAEPFAFEWETVQASLKSSDTSPKR
jgi:predicted Zn-dependent protease